MVGDEGEPNGSNDLPLDDSVYMIFEAPLYKLRTGNFVTKREAENEKLKLNREGYKDVWIVRSRIEQNDRLIDWAYSL